MKIDFTLISGARPTLLEATLASVQQKILRNFELGTCYANIDLFGGSEAERHKCETIIREYFPSAIITKPENPSFGMAVKTLWSRPREEYILHFEDDWEVLEDITPTMVEPLFTGNTRSVKLVCREMNWNGTNLFYERNKKLKIFNKTLWSFRAKASVFGTGPAFFHSEFVNLIADLLNPRLDPEKQMRRPNNLPLNDYTEQFMCRLLPGKEHHEIIRDTGREWQRQTGTRKVYRGPRVTWIRK